MRHYLVLLSLSAKNAESGKRVIANLRRRVDENAKTLWFDASHIGIVVTADQTAAAIWRAADISGAEDARDALIVELGGDWCASRDAAAEHWLTTHVGQPLPERYRG